MKFGRIERIILFGGSPLLAGLAGMLKNKKADFVIFSSKRQLNEPFGRGDTTLEKELKRLGVKYLCADDINDDKRLPNLVSGNTLGIGIGECWSFSKKLINLFGGKLVDFMGIPLPEYRGGAHYSWHILQGRKDWGCCLQMINEDMVPGVFDSSALIKSVKYMYPASVKTPQDRFEYSVVKDVKFLSDFLDDIKRNKDFKSSLPDENKSMFFPRLSTIKQGYINWAWSAEEIATFIAAFDDPYRGASTFIDSKRVFLKKCSVVRSDGGFHPFQAGLIYRIHKNTCYIAVSGGTLVIKEVLDEKGKNMMRALAVGSRFYTPLARLEEAMQYRAEYDSKGLKGSRNG